MTPPRAEVVVVGSGIVGLCSAWYLRDAGAEVTVLSRKPGAGGEASAGNAGMIVPSHVVPLSAPGAVSQGIRYLFSKSSPFHIKPRLDSDLVRWLWRFWRSATETHVREAAPVLRDLSLASVDLLTELQAEIGDFFWCQTGLLMVYHSEVRELSGDWNVYRAARWILDNGPKVVVVKQGAYGAVLVERGGIFYVPAFPLEEVFDPTGAGDAFAGGFMAHLARTDDLSPGNLRRAMVYGAAMGAFAVERFSVQRFDEIGVAEVSARVRQFADLVRFDIDPENEGGLGSYGDGPAQARASR